LNDHELALIKHIAARGNRYVWFAYVPRRLRIPEWWRWTWILAGTLGADFVAYRVSRDGMLAAWPANHAHYAAESGNSAATRAP